MKSRLSLPFLICLMACGSQQSVSKQAKTPHEKKDTEARTRVDVPKNVLAYGVVRNPLQLVTRINQIGTLFNVSVPSPGMLPGMVTQNVLGLMSVDGIDFSQPLGLVRFLAQKNGQSEHALVVSLSDPTKLEAMLPQQTRLKNDRGNAFSFERSSDKYKIFVNLIGHRAVFTGAASRIDEIKGFVAGMFEHAKNTSFSGYLAAENWIHSKRSIIQQLLPRAMPEFAQREGKSLKLTPEEIKRIVEGVVTLVDDLAGLAVSCTLEDDFRLKLSVVPKRDSKLAAQFERLEAREHRLLRRLPPHSPVFVSSAVSKATGDAISAYFEISGLNIPFLSSQLETIKLSEATTQAKEHLDSAWLATSDHTMAASTHTYPNSNVLRTSIVAGVNDEDAIRKAWQHYWQALVSDPAVLGLFSDNAQPEVKTEAYFVNGSPVTEVKLPFKSLSDASNIKKASAHPHIIFTDSTGVFTFGAHGRAELEHLVGGHYSGLETKAGVKYVLKTAADNAMLIAYLSPIEFLEQLKIEAGKNLDKVLALKAAHRDQAVGMSLGRSGEELEFVIAMPTALIEPLIVLGTRVWTLTQRR